MGCFLGCFGAAKDKKDRRRRSRRKRSPSHSPAASRARHSPSKADRDADAASAAAPLLATLLELRDSADDLCLAVVAKKKVTFDPNVTAYEAPPIPEGEEEEEEGRAAAKGGEEEAWTLLGPECAKSEAFPLNHRYGSCAGADGDSDYEDCYDDDDEYDDEYEDDEEEYEDGIDECAADDDEEHHGGLLGLARAEDEACESLFLLPVPAAKPAAKDVVGAAPEAPAVPVADPDTAVLSSVENFGQWKDATKPRTAAPKDSAEKENSVVTLSDPAAKQKQEKPAVSWDYTPRTPSKQEASVDTSLSTWLGSCGTPESNYSARSRSPISREDRPILGALTVEDIKISSANSTPSRRSRSPSPSPDDMPILGTVGAYWNCSGGANGGGHDDSVTRGGFMKTRSRFGQNFA